MVFLSDLPNQWPWNREAAPQLQDKEILTQMVLHPAKTVTVRLFPPIKTFAYVGIRFIPFGTPHIGSGSMRIVRQNIGIPDSTVFGFPWDQALLAPNEWCPFGYPLTHTLCKKNKLEAQIHLDENFVGKIEVLCQKFDDLLDGHVCLGIVNDQKRQLQWIQDCQGNLHVPGTAGLSHSIKLIPSLYRLLDTNESPWEDRSKWIWIHDLDSTLYEIPEYPTI
jgi:hypothetical protein